MRSLYLWPDMPVLSLLVLLVIAQLLCYAARVPVHRALRKGAAALGGGLRLVARWLRSTSEELRRRNREVLLESGRLQAETKVEHEFTRLAADNLDPTGYRKRLGEWEAKLTRTGAASWKVILDPEELAREFTQGL